MGSPEGWGFSVKSRSLCEPPGPRAFCRVPGSLTGAGDRPRGCREGCPGAASGTGQEGPVCLGWRPEDLHPAGRPRGSAGVRGGGDSACSHSSGIAGTPGSPLPTLSPGSAPSTWWPWAWLSPFRRLSLPSCQNGGHRVSPSLVLWDKFAKNEACFKQTVDARHVSTDTATVRGSAS